MKEKDRMHKKFERLLKSVRDSDGVSVATNVQGQSLHVLACMGYLRKGGFGAYSITPAGRRYLSDLKKLKRKSKSKTTETHVCPECGHEF